MLDLTLLKTFHVDGKEYAEGKNFIEFNGEKAKQLIESGFAKLREKSDEDLEAEERDKAILREHDLRADNGFFDEHGKPIPQQIAKCLKKVFEFKTMRDNGDMYYFNGKFYVHRAETVIEEKCNALLEDKSKTHTISEVVNLIKFDTYVDRSIAVDGIICLKNGLYNLKTKKLEPFTKDIFITRQLPVKYIENAGCQKINEFISQILSKSDVPVIQELIGYCLHNGYEIQKAAMFIGEGGNGKSTLLNLIKTLLGQGNVSAISLQALDTNRFAAASLFGKMANIYNDLPDAALHKTGQFKMLTGGDPITAEKKFGQPFEFTNTAKLLFSCNKVPESLDSTPAFFRRWVFINFPNKFEGKEADKNLLKKLTTPEELSGLFNWAIEGLNRLLENGDFSNSKSTLEMQDQYERLSSPIAAFVKDCIESSEPYRIDSQGVLLKADLYKSFVEYCNHANLPACASNTFGKDLPRHLPSVMAGKTRQDGRQQPCWRGISFIVNNEMEAKKEPQQTL